MGKQEVDDDDIDSTIYICLFIYGLEFFDLCIVYLVPGAFACNKCCIIIDDEDDDDNIFF